MLLELALPVFVAGILTFLAPCTLPLVPSFLVFIGGSSAHQAQTDRQWRWRLLRNALLYVAGFSLVFIALGVGLGLLAQYGLAHLRFTLERLSGLLIVFFGLSMLGVFEGHWFAWMQRDTRFTLPSSLTPGRPLSAFVFGAAFAFGWSPCIGPILGSVLLLASSSGTVLQGALLLGVFSLGLGLPFLLMAAGVGQATRVIRGLQRYLPLISRVGGGLLVVLGVLLLTGNMGLLTRIVMPLFSWIDQERLLDFF